MDIKCNSIAFWSVVQDMLPKDKSSYTPMKILDSWFSKDVDDSELIHEVTWNIRPTLAKRIKDINDAEDWEELYAYLRKHGDDIDGKSWVTLFAYATYKSIVAETISASCKAGSVLCTENVVDLEGTTHDFVVRVANCLVGDYSGSYDSAVCVLEAVIKGDCAIFSIIPSKLTTDDINLIEHNMWKRDFAFVQRMLHDVREWVTADVYLQCFVVLQYLQMCVNHSSEYIFTEIEYGPEEFYNIVRNQSDDIIVPGSISGVYLDLYHVYDAPQKFYRDKILHYVGRKYSREVALALLNHDWVDAVQIVCDEGCSGSSNILDEVFEFCVLCSKALYFSDKKIITLKREDKLVGGLYKTCIVASPEAITTVVKDSKPETLEDMLQDILEFCANDAITAMQTLLSVYSYAPTSAKELGIQKAIREAWPVYKAHHDK